MKRKLSLSYELVERYGRSYVEVDVTDGERIKTIHSAGINPEYVKGTKEAAWEIATDALVRLFEEE